MFTLQFALLFSKNRLNYGEGPARNFQKPRVVMDTSIPPEYTSFMSLLIAFSFPGEVFLAPQKCSLFKGSLFTPLCIVHIDRKHVPLSITNSLSELVLS